MSRPAGGDDRARCPSRRRASRSDRGCARARANSPTASVVAQAGGGSILARGGGDAGRRGGPGADDPAIAQPASPSRPAVARSRAAQREVCTESPEARNGAAARRARPARRRPEPVRCGAGHRARTLEPGPVRRRGHEVSCRDNAVPRPAARALLPRRVVAHVGSPARSGGPSAAGAGARGRRRVGARFGIVVSCYRIRAVRATRFGRPGAGGFVFPRGRPAR